MKQLVERLGGKLTRVVIGEVRDNTYFATLHLKRPGEKDLTVDARPSDAIALALRFHGPILVAEELFVRAAAGRASGAACWSRTWPRRRPPATWRAATSSSPSTTSPSARSASSPPAPARTPRPSPFASPSAARAARSRFASRPPI